MYIYIYVCIDIYIYIFQIILYYILSGILSDILSYCRSGKSLASGPHAYPHVSLRMFRPCLKDKPHVIPHRGLAVTSRLARAIGIHCLSNLQNKASGPSTSPPAIQPNNGKQNASKSFTKGSFSTARFGCLEDSMIFHADSGVSLGFGHATILRGPHRGAHVQRPAQRPKSPARFSEGFDLFLKSPNNSNKLSRFCPARSIRFWPS